MRNCDSVSQAAQAVSPWMPRLKPVLSLAIKACADAPNRGDSANRDNGVFRLIRELGCYGLKRGWRAEEKPRGEEMRGRNRDMVEINVDAGGQIGISPRGCRDRRQENQSGRQRNRDKRRNAMRHHCG